MNQKLSEWANIAEIMSGIAVLVTLIFLIAGINENTDVVRSSAYDTNLQTLIDWRFSILQDPDSMRVFSAYFDDRADIASFSPVDQTRLRLIFSALWIAYEKSYFAKGYGLLGGVEWERFLENLCGNYGRIRAFWVQSISSFLTEEFKTYVVNTCDSSRR
jgi:hypothetical protein